MIDPKFSGIFPALLTPFDANNQVNETESEKLVKYNLAKGVKGFYVSGSTAEAFLLSTDERKQIMTVIKNAAPDATLIAHVGSVNEAEAIALGKQPHIYFPAPSETPRITGELSS